MRKQEEAQHDALLKEAQGIYEQTSNLKHLAHWSSSDSSQRSLRGPSVKPRSSRPQGSLSGRQTSSVASPSIALGTGVALTAAKDAEIQKLKHEIAQLKSYARSSSSPVPPKSPRTSESLHNSRLKSTGAGTEILFVFDSKDRDRAAEAYDEIAQLKFLLMSDKKKIRPLLEGDGQIEKNLRWLPPMLPVRPSSCDRAFDVQAAARGGR